MTTDKFSFIDEVFEEYQLGNATLKSDQGIMNAKNSLIKNFEKLMLEVIGLDATLNDIYGDDWRNNYGHTELQVRDAARWLQRKQRKALESMLSKSRGDE